MGTTNDLPARLREHAATHEELATPDFLRVVADDMDNLELPLDIDSAVRLLRYAANELERLRKAVLPEED